MKRLLLCCIGLTACLVVFGQSAKKMNSIKRSSQYLYAEATMASAQEAYDVANDLLLIQVKEYANGKKSFKDKDILIKNINSGRDSIQMRRGDMVKVFLYVKKSDIVGVDNVTLVEGSGETASKKEDAVPSSVVPVSVPDQNAPASEAAPAASDESLKLPAAWQQSVVEQLLASDSFGAAKALLSRLKAEFKVKKTGPLASCKDVPGSFIVIGRNGKVETVLGPGASERTDFRTLSKVPANLPSGTDIVWFTFAK